MGFIKKERDYIKVIIGFVLIGFFAFSPLIIGLVGSYIESKRLGHPVHEGNSAIATLPWFMFYTIPLGILFALIWLIISIVQISKFQKQK